VEVLFFTCRTIKNNTGCSVHTETQTGNLENEIDHYRYSLPFTGNHVQPLVFPSTPIESKAHLTHLYAHNP